MNTKPFLARLTCTGLFATLVAAAPLKADEWMKFGGGLHVVNPGGDVTDEKKVYVKIKMGFGLSLFGEMGLNDKMALRGRVDYNVFGEGKKDDSYENLTDIYKSKGNATTVFADYIYRFDSHEKGLYAFAGLGLVSAKAELENNWWGTYSDNKYTSKSSISGSNLGFSLGLGYNLSSNMGLELSYVSASNVMKLDDSDDYDDKDKYGINWVQVSFKYRF